MQPLATAIYDCTAMAVRVLEARARRRAGGGYCRQEEVALLLTDGSVWLLTGIFVKVGEQSLYLRCAAWSL